MINLNIKAYGTKLKKNLLAVKLENILPKIFAR